jgi:hypothetical protein
MVAFGISTLDVWRLPGLVPTRNIGPQNCKPMFDVTRETPHCCDDTDFASAHFGNANYEIKLAACNTSGTAWHNCQFERLRRFGDSRAGKQRFE